MMNLFRLTVAIYTILIPLTTEISLSQSTQSSASESTDETVCYMQTEDGTTLDLTSVCGKAPTSSINPPATTNQQQNCSSEDECGNPPPPLNLPPDGSPIGLLTPNIYRFGNAQST